MLALDDRLSARVMMARSNLSCAPALMEELFDHAQRDPVAVGDFFPRSLPLVVGSQDAFAQIQRECFHANTLLHLPHNGHSFI
jgi:hypothetical protein